MRTARLVAVCIAVLGAALAASPAFGSAPAVGAVPGPTAMTLSGPGLAKSRTIVATEHPDLFKDLLAEVDWLATRPGNAPDPDAAKLGPKFQVVVRVGDADGQAYDLYPLAVGGPRVFRPAKQPKGTVAAAWFYGRVSMPDTLRAAGVPLVIAAPVSNPSGAPSRGAGGQGGGVTEGQLGAVSTPSTNTSIGQLMRDWQRGVLLIGGGALLLLVLLGSVSFLIRKP